jgi:arylsulfatase A-like enzyme
LIVRWPGHVKRGVSDAMVSQVDLLASLAAAWRVVRADPAAVLRGE